MTIQNPHPTTQRKLLRGKRKTGPNAELKSVGLVQDSLPIGKTFQEKQSQGWRSSNGISNIKMFRIPKDAEELCGMLGEEQAA